MIAAIASYNVLFSNSQAERIKAAIAMSVPPGRLNDAAGAPVLLLKTGRAAQVTAYASSRAIVLMVRAATNELLKVSISIKAVVM